MCPPANLDDIPCSIDPSVRGSETVRVKLLGTFTISVGSRIISQDEWRPKKAANLIKLLVLAPGHRLHREQVMKALWPDLETNCGGWIWRSWWNSQTSTRSAARTDRLSRR